MKKESFCDETSTTTTTQTTTTTKTSNKETTATTTLDLSLLFLDYFNARKNGGKDESYTLT